MYIAASLAVVADLTPPALLVPSTALFMFFVTIIAGNCPLLVPVALNVVMHKSYHTFTVDAAPVAAESATTASSEQSAWGGDGFLASSVQYSSSERSGRDLQQVMIVLICALYVASSLIYFLVMLLCPPTPAAARPASLVGGAGEERGDVKHGDSTRR